MATPSARSITRIQTTHTTLVTGVFILAWIGVTSCDPSSDRPAFGPKSGAIVDTIAATPDVVISHLASVIDSVGIQTRSQSVRDGYLDTRGYDVINALPRGRDTYNPERVVIFRFWADALPGDRTRLTGEATYRTTHDPSLEQRLAETIAKPDHPGHMLLLRILNAAKSRAGG